MARCCVRLALLMLVICSQMSPAFAQQLSFWRHSLLSELSPDEIQSFQATIQQALEQAPDTEVIEWRSQNGEKGGKILPKFSYESQGQNCRRTVFQVNEQAGGKTVRKENYHFDICKGPEGWKVHSIPTQFSKEERESLATFLTQVFNNQEDGIPITWQGDSSGTKTVVVPLSQSQGCRVAAISIIYTEGNSVNGQYRFCKNENNEWRYQPE